MQRFPGEVEAVLREAGWSEGRYVPDAASAAITTVCAYTAADGARHTSFRAAEQALGEFTGIYVSQDGPGVTLRRRPFAIDPTLATPTAATLAAFGQALGIPLFPLGVEGTDDAVLAIDERGRVFALDAGGEWFLGDRVEAALTTLVTGAQPPRVRDDGRW
ncbi:SUKH-3 domain-containing protein [Cryptosporangium sp. NPDC048952]|uniref:SUKH-3 domain-containing protein n=1 Tax=Cryptosporangium sp. NPDC048952 TaxID=3363961 RepID=UPI003710A073